MAERTKPGILTKEDIDKYGKYSPEEIARIINASLFRLPGDSAAFKALNDNIHKNEEFILELMKTINPHTTAFFQNIMGICETRMKEAEEESIIRESNQADSFFPE